MFGRPPHDSYISINYLPSHSITSNGAAGVGGKGEGEADHWRFIMLRKLDFALSRIPYTERAVDRNGGAGTERLWQDSQGSSFGKACAACSTRLGLDSDIYLYM